MSHKACAMIDFLLAAVNVAVATSGTSNYPWVQWGFAVLLFGTGLANLVECLLEGKDG